MTHHLSTSETTAAHLGLVFIYLMLLFPAITFAETTKLVPQNTDEEGETVIQDSMNRIESIHQLVEALRLDINNGREVNTANSSKMQNLSEALALIDDKLLQASAGLDDSQSNIKTNSRTINELREELILYSRDIRANAADLSSQKSLIEDNSIRLYEILLQLGSLDQELTNFAESLGAADNNKELVEFRNAMNSDLDGLWILFATVLVFLAPLAFSLSSMRDKTILPDGGEPHQDVLFVIIGVFLSYFIVGFGFMHGQSSGGWFGIPTHLFGSNVIDPDTKHNVGLAELLLYKTGFVVLGALIIFVAIGKQFSSLGHLMMALFVGAILIPIYGHWVNSGQLVAGNEGWLESIGFIDQAGAMTIHTVVGWFAFIIIWRMRPVHPILKEGEEHSGSFYSSGAAILLLLSWWGMTTGTMPVSSDHLSNVMLNTSLAAASGGIAALIQHAFFHADKNNIERGLGGFIGGLVAIAACVQSVTFVEAAFIGVVAGVLQNTAYSILRRFFLKADWQVKAANLIAIHALPGIWGTLCFALLGTDGSFKAPNLIQLNTQVQGIAAALAYSIFMAHAVLIVMKMKKNKSTEMTSASS